MSGVPGISITRLHFTADPEKATPDWERYARTGISDAKFEREFNMNARAGALTAIFRHAYRPHDHERPLDPRGAQLLHSFDFGRGFPARVWFSRTSWNGVRIYASMVGASLPLRAFCQQTIAFEVNTWGDVLSGPRCFCDPAGNQHKDDGMKSVEVLREFGWQPRWRGSRIEDGIEVLSALMLATQPDGEPAFLVDPRYNPTLCLALGGGYKRNKSGLPEHQHPEGDVVDALRYGVINTVPPKVVRPAQPPLAVDPVSGYGRAPMPGVRTHVEDFA